MTTLFLEILLTPVEGGNPLHSPFTMQVENPFSYSDVLPGEQRRVTPLCFDPLGSPTTVMRKNTPFPFLPMLLAELVDSFRGGGPLQPEVA